MRGLELSPVFLAVCLAGVGRLQAGVYLLTPTPTLLPPLERTPTIPFENVRQERENLQSVDDRLYPPNGLLPPSSSRKYYLELAAHLDGQRKAGFFRARDAVSLSGCLIRLGRAGEAARLVEQTLSRLGPSDPFRFLLRLNQACAIQEENNPELLPRAIEYQREAVENLWPSLWAGWDQQQWRWQRRVEQLTLTWMEQRLREQEQNARQPSSSLTLDPLFDTPRQKVRFVGPGGKYQAGAIAFKEENKLPRDAENLVIALLLAHPNDNRLYWLYGELLNARGEVGAARAVLAGLIGSLSSSELLNHRKVLFADEAAFVLANPNNPEAPLRKLFWAVAPRGQLLGGPAEAAHEAAWLAALGNFQSEDRSTPFDPSQPPLPDQGSGPAAVSPLGGWREASIGFAAGVVVGLLLALQWREWHRRREAGR